MSMFPLAIVKNSFLPSLVDGECSQVIVLPAISVWAVSTMPNGDIVSGTSDGMVRVFSESEDRWANSEDLKVSALIIKPTLYAPYVLCPQKYDDEVATQSLPSYVLWGNRAKLHSNISVT